MSAPFRHYYVIRRPGEVRHKESDWLTFFASLVPGEVYRIEPHHLYTRWEMLAPRSVYLLSRVYCGLSVKGIDFAFHNNIGPQARFWRDNGRHYVSVH